MCRIDTSRVDTRATLIIVLGTEPYRPLRCSDYVRAREADLGVDRKVRFVAPSIG